MKKFFLVFALIFALSGAVIAQWQPCNNGLYGGYITSLAANGNYIFAGSLGDGILASSDNGNSWIAINNGLTGQDVNTILLKDNSIYIGTPHEGIFLSTDNGNNWTAINDGMVGLGVNSIVTDGKNIFAGTDKGVIKSTDNGNHWNIENSFQTNHLTISGNYLYAVSGTGIYLSADLGVTWVKKVLPNDYYIINTIAVKDSTIYEGNDGGKIYLSTNYGNNWTLIHTDSTVSDIESIAINGNTIYAVSRNKGMLISSDNGISWNAKNNGLTCFGVDAIVFYNSNILLGTQWGSGIYLSTDKGENWNVENIKLTNIAVFSMVTIGINIFAGTDNGVFLSTDNGKNWTAKNSGLTNLGIGALAVSGTNIFAGTEFGVFLSTNNGTNWQKVNNGLKDTTINALVANGNSVFAGTDGYGWIYKSTDNGTNWDSVYMYYASVYGLKAKGDTIFAGTDDGIFISTNDGLNWTHIVFDYCVFSLAIDGNNIGFGFNGNGLYLSNDNGNYFNYIYLPTLYDVEALAIKGEIIFAAVGENGILLSTDSGTNWLTINQGLTNLDIGCFLINNDTVFAGTVGGGVFQSRISDFQMKPGISMINYFSVYEDSTNSIEFTVRGKYPDELKFIKISSDTSLISSDGIMISDTGTCRTMTITPNKKKFGSCTISIFVTDGIDTAQTSFYAYVNKRPEISNINDITIYEDSSKIINFTVEGASVNYLDFINISSDTNLIPLDSLLIYGSDTNKKIRIAPINGKLGSSTISIEVSDGNLTAQTSFLVTVIKPTDVDDKPLLQFISISPNPTTDFLNISGLQDELVQIYSIVGEKLIETNVGTQRAVSLQIDVSALPTGIYILKAGTNLRKFVKL